jgi:hypothetical protein
MNATNKKTETLKLDELKAQRDLLAKECAKTFIKGQIDLQIALDRAVNKLNDEIEEAEKQLVAAR